MLKKQVYSSCSSRSGRAFRPRYYSSHLGFQFDISQHCNPIDFFVHQRIEYTFPAGVDVL